MKVYNLKSQIRSALRRVWLYSPLRRNALIAARVSRGVYRCKSCKELHGPKEMDVDHIIPATPADGINQPEDWGLFIKNLLYCGDEGVVAICKPCHKKKTQEERNEKKTRLKKTKRVKRLRVSRNARTNSRRKKRTVHSRHTRNGRQRTHHARRG